MSWRPSTKDLLFIADAGFGGHSVEKMAAALGITPAEFKAWSASLVATRAAPLAPPPPPPPPPPAPTSRVIAERAFQAQPDAHIDDLAGEN